MQLRIDAQKKILRPRKRTNVIVADKSRGFSKEVRLVVKFEVGLNLCLPITPAMRLVGNHMCPIEWHQYR